MQVALISDRGIRFMDVSILHEEIRLEEPVRADLVLKYGHWPPPAYRRFVKMDDHTYGEKN